VAAIWPATFTWRGGSASWNGPQKRRRRKSWSTIYFFSSMVKLRNSVSPTAKELWLVGPLGHTIGKGNKTTTQLYWYVRHSLNGGAVGPPSMPILGGRHGIAPMLRDIYVVGNIPAIGFPQSTDTEHVDDGR